MQERITELIFNEKRQALQRVFTGISQESLISSILFLIYIRNLFLKVKVKLSQVQTLSYIDDVALYIEESLAKKNCKVLKRTVKTVFKWAPENTVKFDDSKSEIIYFFRKKQEAKNSVTLSNNTIIKSVKIIK